MTATKERAIELAKIILNSHQPPYTALIELCHGAIEAAILEEREACLGIAEQAAKTRWDSHEAAYVSATALAIAEAIRKRGQ